MVKLVNEEIIEKLDEIIALIKNSDEYQKYLELSSKTRSNEEIMQLIEQVKEIQKKIVKKEVLREDTSSLEKMNNDLLKQLNEIPLYQEFTYVQEDLNNTLQNVKKVIQDSINDRLN